MANAPIGRLVAAPRSRDRDKPRDKACTSRDCLFFNRTPGNQATHTMSDYVALPEAIAFSQQLQARRHRSCYPFQAHATGVMKEPNLVSFSIEVIAKITPILGRTANTVNEQDWYPHGIIRLGKVDAGAMFTEKRERTP